MSAIAGLIRFDGRDASLGQLKAMIETIRHRGPDGIETWANGMAAVSHLRLAVTPESLREHQPHVDLASGAVLLADVRLDGREDLASKLGLKHTVLLSPDGPTDAELLMRAYLKWGDETPRQLDGDFAFVIWNPRDQSVFAAVDPFGVRTLYVHDAPGKMFAFASEAKALLAHSEIPDSIDEIRLAHYLSGTRTDLERSIFEAIRSVAPAHALRADRAGVRTWKYYEMAPARGLGPLEGDEGVEAFGEQFEAAVRDRTRSAFPVGAQLSGGLDSSSIAVVARDALAERNAGPLHTFTLTFDETPSTDERDYAQAVLDQGGFHPHFVSADELSPLGNIDEVYTHLDNGLVGGTQHQGWAMLLAARDAGVRVVMDGFDGDTVIGHGDSLLREAAARGEWKSFKEMAVAMNQRYRNADHQQNFQEAFSTFAGVFGQYGWPVLLDQASFGPRRKILWSIWAAGRAGVIDRADALRKLRRTLTRSRSANLYRREQIWQTRPRSIPSFVDPAFAKRSGIDLGPGPLPRVDEMGKKSVRQLQQETLSSPNVQGALHIPSLLAASLGFDLTHPFFDRRVIEICLALPSEQSFSDGWTRYFLRQAMAGRLPDTVAWRVGKAQMTPAVDRALRLYDTGRLRALAADPGWLDEYLDMDKLRKYARLDRPLTDLELTRLAWISTAVLWLNRQWPNGLESPSVWGSR